MHRSLTAVLLAGLLAACASPAQERPSSSDSPATPATPGSHAIAMGEQLQLDDGSRLTYLHLLNDSRCPPEVQCVWAGDAEIQLRWQPERGSAQLFSLHTQPLRGKGSNSVTLGGLNIRLQALERGPAPKATLGISPQP